LKVCPGSGWGRLFSGGIMKNETRAERHAQRVVDDVLHERDYQRSRWSIEEDVLHSHCEWIAILTTWLGKAGISARTGDDSTLRKRLVQVAAISMAAVEALDRSKS
jgi:hypothetical protein